MRRYIGCDVHARSCTFAIKDERGRRVCRDVVETNGRALVGYFQRIPGERHLCFEEGEQSQWTDYHYYPIVDYLRENPGSESNTRDVEHGERAAAQIPRALKPLSADIVESELSHLLGAIARGNGAIGAAVFDTTGLKVGAAGLEMEGLVLPADRLAKLEKAPEDPPVEVRYTCNKLRELTKACSSNVVHGPPCFRLDEFARDCKGPSTVYYRPVIDHRRESSLLGFSMLVVQNEPPCKDARQ